MKTIDRLKCVLFGHPKGAILHDAEVHIRVTSAKNPFTIGYCTRCGEIVFTELDNFKARLDQVRKVVEKMEKTWPALQSLPKKPKPPKNVRVKEGKER